MLRSTVLVALLVLAAQARLQGLEKEVRNEDLHLFSKFQAFAEKHDKSYASLEEARERFQVYRSNQLTVQLYQQNEQADAQYGETRFMDLTPEEFRAAYLPPIPADATVARRRLSDAELTGDVKDLPESLDWRTEGLVTPVKNQAMCGSCWAFSVTGNIEGQWKLKSGNLVSLSEQQLLDCDKKDEACNGGYPLWTYQEIIRLGGLESEQDYPYKQHKQQACQAVNDKYAVYINDSLELPKDEAKIQQYLFKAGPLSVAINANPLQFYTGGIHHPWKFFCSPKALNHAVLMVGYGTDNNTPFWLIKNSWGEGWGEKGYLRLYRGDNTCGIQEMVTSAIIG